ncbi:MAG: heme o synthase, partial [Planctomycetes bacterium]|nr:heme o synthase [Planctomycetota bacterium]
VLGAPDGGQLEMGPLVATMVGTTLVAMAASILNQLWEVRFDRRMERTRGRPLVTGRVGSIAAVAASIVTAGLGLWILVEGTHALTAGLALATLLSYVLVYTPLKRRATANTLVGAVPGALPILIGWSAASGTLSGASGSLFAILFFWQVPHFLAIAWIYREDYARGGFRMLSVTDPTGRRSGAMAVIYTLCLIAVSMGPSLLGVTGWFSVWAAPMSGIIMLVPAWRFAFATTEENARSLFVASLVHLPLLLGILLCDPTPRLFSGTAPILFR